MAKFFYKLLRTRKLNSHKKLTILYHSKDLQAPKWPLDFIRPQNDSVASRFSALQLWHFTWPFNALAVPFTIDPKDAWRQQALGRHVLYKRDRATVITFVKKAIPESNARKLTKYCGAGCSWSRSPSKVPLNETEFCHINSLFSSQKESSC